MSLNREWRAAMPYRSREVVERWVREFHEDGHSLGGSFHILEHHTDAGESTGLVSLVVDGAQTSTIISPTDAGDGHWMVTFESRDAAVELSAADAARLAERVTAVADLCRFLEEKSLAFLSSRAG